MIHEGWFVFQDTTLWRQRFLKRGFGHVFYLGRDKYNWFLINPLERYCQFTILSNPIKERLDLAAKEKYTKVIYIEYTDNLIGEKPPCWGGFLNCTTASAYLVGIRTGLCTPYQFYKKLLKMKYGARKPPHLISIKEVEKCPSPPPLKA